MPGTLSPLEEKTSVILLTSPVRCSLLQALQSAILLPAYCAQEEGRKTRGSHQVFHFVTSILAFSWKSFRSTFLWKLCNFNPTMTVKPFQKKNTCSIFQVSTDHQIMQSQKTKAWYGHESYPFIFEKNSFRGLYSNAFLKKKLMQNLLILLFICMHEINYNGIVLLI